MTEQHVIYSSYMVRPYGIVRANMFGVTQEETRYEWLVNGGTLYSDRSFTSEADAHEDARRVFGL